MVMQAFIDDSLADNEVLILAGYVASASQWAEFSDRWHELLTIRPAWDDFKMSRIMDEGGDESRERVLHHYALVQKHVRLAIGLAIPFRHINKVQNVLKLGQGFYNPYYWAWTILIDALITGSRNLNVEGPIDFIFDEQSECLKAFSLSSDILDQLKARHPGGVSNLPIFRSDKEFLPLQAADMFAWILRKKFLARGTIMGSPHYEFPWGQEMLVPDTICCEFTEYEAWRLGYEIMWDQYHKFMASPEAKWNLLDSRSPAYIRMNSWLAPKDGSPP